MENSAPDASEYTASDLEERLGVRGTLVAALLSISAPTVHTASSMRLVRGSRMRRLTDGSLGNLNVTEFYMCFVGHLGRAIEAMLVLMRYLCL